ncbi:makorin, ring finger protein, 4 [Thunnus maccoyii]|uniref:makorin, ring finger protein, 4 n=1 Tax=Thunnus maccoyii TaxID=8240 RepID=UPI001C4CED3F|nr:makorin, ring finger protein, 4 [Thunnus maccoyii]
MEGDWRHGQNTRRRMGSEMERFSAARSGGICRRFINGSCRLGPRCNYRHEWPVISSSQICRYYQKGGCWYGDRCRYLHILQPEGDAAVAGRRASMPSVSSSRVATAPPGRRGSVPGLMQVDVTSRRERSMQHSHSVVNVSNPQHNTGRLAADIAEDHSRDTDSHLAASWESVQSSVAAHAGACDGRNDQETSSKETEDVGAAAASTSQGKVEEMEAFLQSKNVTCGICMDKVYEKADPRNQIFGILPNCNHSFCLHCIRTWRKTKDLGLDAIKSCPQCRVRSAFYVPNKYWVEGQAKESLIAAFKEKFSKKSCSYYTRYGCCPFKTECLYRHDKTARYRSFPYVPEDEDDDDGVDLLNFFIAMTLLSSGDDDDNDDDFDFPFYLTEEYDF